MSVNRVKMSGDPSRPRTFQSREIIWNAFESMSRELDVPIDDLVNEAMASYARVRGYGTPGPRPRSDLKGSLAPRHDALEETRDAPVMSALDRSYMPSRPPGQRDEDDLAKTSSRGSYPRGARLPDPLHELGSESRTAPRVNASSSRVPLPAALGRMPGPAVPPPGTRPSAPFAARPPLGSGAVGGVAPPPLPGRVGPPPLSSPGLPSRAPAPSTRLFLTYHGHPYSVEKDRFLIGRSKTQADLRLDDPNVSRQHAVIERAGATWYIVDLGSTNGVHIGGERVARRALADGDVIQITSHDIICSIR